MTKADLYRKELLKNIISEGKQLNNRINLTVNNGVGLYSEILTLDEISLITENFTTHSSVNEYLEELVNKRFEEIFEDFGYKVNESELYLDSTNCYDGYELNIPIIKENYHPVHELFNEIDQVLNPVLKNKASETPLTKEPETHNTPNTIINC